MIVVIVTHRRPKLLKCTLDSLVACHSVPESVRTLVVETGVQSGAREVVNAADPCLMAGYLFVESRVKTVALNRALEACGDELLVFLDDDVRVCPELLAAYRRAAAATGPGVYFGGPTAVDYDVEPPEWLKRYLPPSAVGLAVAPVHDRSDAPSFFLGFNWAAFASDIRACGGFSGDFGPGTPVGVGDETFLQRRMHERGIRAQYVPEARVWHYVPPERCSPKWALARARRTGLASGIVDEHTLRTNGRPYRKWRALIRQSRRLVRMTRPRQLVLFRPDARFWIRYAWARLAGFWQGLSIGARRRPLDDDVWRKSQHLHDSP